MNWWIGVYQYLPDVNIWVHIYANDQNDISAVKEAHNLFSIVRQNEYKLREYAYSALDELNLDKDLREISSEDFCGKTDIGIYYISVFGRRM